MTQVSEVLAQKRVIVCCGAGGVGKTTVSASLALAAARAGRRVLVVTIDPSRRLAETLGVSRNLPEPAALPAERLAAAGVHPPGSLSAWMLDPQLVSHRVVRGFSKSEARRRIDDVIQRVHLEIVVLQPIDTLSKGYNISSDGITTGAIQVPGNGLPIIMVNDRQTTGGYPKIANVSSVDLPRLGRMKPLSRVRFQAISVAEAEQLKCDQEEAIRALSGSIEPLPDPDNPSSRVLRHANIISGVVSVRE